jgi:hypothetical protein
MVSSTRTRIERIIKSRAGINAKFATCAGVFWPEEDEQVGLSGETEADGRDRKERREEPGESH